MMLYSGITSSAGQQDVTGGAEIINLKRNGAYPTWGLLIGLMGAPHNHLVQI